MARFISPLCIGYHMKVDASSHTVQQQDGFVSSMLLLILITSAGLTLSLAHWLTEGILESTVEILLLLFMLTAGILCAYSIHKGEPNEVCPSVGGSFKNIIKAILPLIGIVLFYVLGLFLDFFRIICHLTCMSTFSYCGLLSSFVISVAYHFGRIFFMGLLMLFCIKLHNKVLPLTCANRYILAIIIAATMCVWIDSTLWDSKDIFAEDANKISYTCNPAGNDTSYKCDSNCLNQTTTLYEVVETMSPYFYPLNIEFLLLVIESLFHLFFGMKPEDNDLTQRAGIDDAHPTVTDSSGSTTGMDAGQNTVVAETTPLLEQPSSGMNTNSVYVPMGREQPSSETREQPSSETREQPSSETREQPSSETREQPSSETREQPSSEPRGQPSSGMNRLFFFAIIFNIAFVVLAALTYITDSEPHWILIYQYAKPMIWTILLAVTSVALHVTRDFKSKSPFQSYSGLDLLVMMTTLGFYIYSFFSIISALAVAVHQSTSTSPHAGPRAEGADQIYLGEYLTLFFNEESIVFPRSFPYIVLLDQVLNTAQIYLQTVFMLHAGRVQAGGSTDHLNRLRVFKDCLIFLVISNFTIWAVDSFIEMKSIQLEPVQMTFFNHYSKHTWQVIAHVIMPIMLFYRFNSFIIMLQVYLDQ